MSWMSWRVMGISSVLIHMFYVCSDCMRTKGQHSVNGKAVDIKVWGFGVWGVGASRGLRLVRPRGRQENETPNTIRSLISARGGKAGIPSNQFQIFETLRNQNSVSSELGPY